MKRHIQIGALAAALGILSTAGAAHGEDAVSAPAIKTIGQTSAAQMVPSLAVLNSGDATLANGKLTLTGVAPNSIVLADRPVRSAGHVLTTEFINEWDIADPDVPRPPHGERKCSDGACHTMS